MNPFDMAVVAILGYSVIRGIFRGIIRELAAIIGIIGGFYLAYSNYHAVAPIFARWISSPLYMDVAAFLFLFCGIFAGVTVLGLILRTLLKIALLGVFDRIFGAFFGVLKGAVIVGILFFLLTTFLPRGGAAVVRQSRLAPAVNSIAGAVAQIFPEDASTIANKMEALKREWAGQALKRTHEQARSVTVDTPASGTVVKRPEPAAGKSKSAVKTKAAAGKTGG